MVDTERQLEIKRFSQSYGSVLFENKGKLVIAVISVGIIAAAALTAGLVMKSRKK